MTPHPSSHSKIRSIGLLETTGYAPAMIALDRMEKAASIRVLQAEINDFLGIIIKIEGNLADVETAINQGREIAGRLHGQPRTEVLQRPDAKALKAILSRPEHNPLIQQDVVHLPGSDSIESDQHESESPIVPQGKGDTQLSKQQHHALGFIETQGFTAVFDAIDRACKAANVEVVGKEKLGGGYVTVIVSGDVAAVTAAIENGKQNVGELGKLIAAHVIPRPSQAVMSLLPS